MINLAYINKFLAAAVSVLGVILSQHLAPASYDKWLSGGIAIIGALAVYLVPNGQSAKSIISDAVQKEMANQPTRVSSNA